MFVGVVLILWVEVHDGEADATDDVQEAAAYILGGVVVMGGGELVEIKEPSTMRGIAARVRRGQRNRGQPLCTSTRRDTA